MKGTRNGDGSRWRLHAMPSPPHREPPTWASPTYPITIAYTREQCWSVVLRVSSHDPDARRPLHMTVAPPEPDRKS